VDRSLREGAIAGEDKFFRRPSSTAHLTRSGDGQQGLSPACRGRKRTIPRMARAKNMRGQWKYLVQSAEDDSPQNFEVIVCERLQEACVVDPDSPGNTVCKQAYRMQKMLAVGENGERGGLI